jgi:hypothetical protein
MSTLARRVAALERRGSAGSTYCVWMPYDLTEAEEADWRERHTSMTARAAAGIPPSAQVIIITWYGDRRPLPANYNR